MRKKFTIIFGLLFSLVFLQKSFGQVTSVNYRMKYNTDSCWYDCYVIINAGDASVAPENIAFNSQFSIVTADTDTIEIAKNYQPLKTPTLASSWNISSTVTNPGAAPGYKFWSITPDLAGNPYYPMGTIAGDSIRIFSIRKTNPTTACGEDIRIFINGTDPNSNAPGMGGNDFRNGFTMGNTNQIYAGNSVQGRAPAPKIISLDLSCSAGININLEASTSGCQTPLTYSWTGPNMYSGTTQDVSIVPAVAANNGRYYVTISDNIGCSDTISIFATSKPDAGPDRVVCSNTTQTISGTPNTGTWTGFTSNPGGSPAVTLGNGSASVTFPTFVSPATKTYNYVYSLGTGCTDTMKFTVHALPNTLITDPNACIGDILTNNVTPTTFGTWASTNSTVASITSNGSSITALASGTTKFVFTRSTAPNCSNSTVDFTVNSNPVLVFPGPQDVCIGGTLQANPSTGGTWTSTPTSVATIVANTGVLTGVSAGTATIEYTETSSGCKADTTVDVLTKPVGSFSGSNNICIGATTNLLPNSGGTWRSTNALVATIDNTGKVTGVAAGTAKFIFTSAATLCESDTVGPVTVAPNPVADIAGDDKICVLTGTTLTPTTGGTWVSSNPAIATVTNAGVVTTLTSGSVFFTFTSTLGCKDNTGTLIVDPKPTVSSSANTICVGSTATLSPSLSSGVWTNLTPTIVNMTTQGTNRIITGTSAGEAYLTFVENGSGCKSDSLNVTVEARPVITISTTDICVGGTADLTPTNGGTWQSSNSAIASVNNAGHIVGLSAGTVTFKYTSTASLCVSDDSDPLNVFPRPIVTITGDNSLCVTETTTVSASTGGSGTWTSSNTAVATVNSSGLVTAIAPGTVTITYQDDNGCISAPSGVISVNVKPVVSFTGPNTICIGNNTTVSPTTNGTWVSSDPAVATINNSGIVTGISAGTAQLTYTQTGSDCPSDPLTVTISPRPTVSITGDDALCVGETTTLNPNSGGSWASSNNSYATVTSAGVVTAVAAGVVTMTFTSTAGCVSNPTGPITVNNPSTVNLPDNSLCIGDTVVLTASSTGGVWTSNDTTVAEIVGNTVFAIKDGNVTFSYVDPNGCTSPNTGLLTVNPKPLTTVTDYAICVGKTTQLFPSTNGAWTSSNTAIASVNNTGLVTGVSPGKVVFVYTSNSTTCKSDPTDTITIDAGPNTSLTGDSVLCIGETTTFLPATGGTWTSSNSAIASITDAGVVTAVSAGTVTFTFTETATGCKSVPTRPITVSPRPVTIVTGLPSICIGGTTQLEPSSGGTWVSNNSTVATINNSGIVTGQSAGNATFTFTNSDGCASNPSDTITVIAPPDVSITGPTELCVGGETQLSPTSGGSWTSLMPTIASVDNQGKVTMLAAGKAVFSFFSSAGCAASSYTDTVTATNCGYPDFNATFVDVSVSGDVSTNDQVGAGTNYGPSVTLVDKPSGSVHDIHINSDGTYTFVSNQIGVYKFLVPLCSGSQTTGCPTTDLWITVTDHKLPTPQPVANVDFATTTINTPVTLATLSNDKCVMITGCTLDPSTVTVIDNPSKGTTSVNLTTGDITYTPNTGATGQDTLLYQVCVSGICAQAKQIISIQAATTPNSTVADDDFAVTAEDQPVTGNVLDNDSDPEGEAQTVTAFTSTIPGKGTLVVNADGSWVFNPAPYFLGPIEFIYTAKDSHVPSASVQATLHILVVPDLRIKVRAYLEGALMQNSGALSADGRPLMRDDLRVSKWDGENGKRYITNKDPHYFNPYFYDYSGIVIKDNNFDRVIPGGSPNLTSYVKYDSISTAADTIFDKTGQNALVDWVQLQLRDKNDSISVLATRSCFIQRDGDIVDHDGFSGVRFPGFKIDDYYIVVKHRSHLAVMTKYAQTPEVYTDLVNFTVGPNDGGVATYDFGTSLGYNNCGPTGNSTCDFSGLAQFNNPEITYGYYALWAGTLDVGKGADVSDNRFGARVKFDAPNDDLNVIAYDVQFYSTNYLFNANFDFAFGYLPGDYNMDGKTKFDNPNDDKNYLYNQVLSYPLNAEGLYLSNFNFVIEQVPH